MKVQRSTVILAGVGAALLVSLGLWGPRFAEAQSRPAELPSAEQRLKAWQEAEAGERIQASFTFQRLLADDQVEQVVRRTGVQPFAVHMSAEGMLGVHRVDPARAAVAVIGDARRATVSMKENALRSNAARASAFLTEHPQEAVVEQEDVAAEAQYLLSSREQEERILTAARRGAPMIFGLEVVGTAEQLGALASDPLVIDFEPAALVEGRTAVPRPEAPATARFRSPEIESLTPAATYSRLRQEAAAGAPAPEGGF